MCGKKIDKEPYDIIENIFGDYREIDGKASDELQSIPEKYGIFAEIYKTKNNELISFGMEGDDFGNRELEKYKIYGEELYEKSGKEVCIYIIGLPNTEFNITKEFESDAEIKIYVSIIEYGCVYESLRHIESLVENGQKLNNEDLFALKMVPSMGPPEKRRQLRYKCLELWKTIVERRLIE